MDIKHIVIIYKKTAYTYYMEHEDPTVRRLIKKNDPLVANIIASHQEHMETLTSVQMILDEYRIRYRSICRNSGQRIGKCDLLLVVGGDGTVLEASKLGLDVPILGVNSSLSFSRGLFCGADSNNFANVISDVVNDKLAKAIVYRLSVDIGGKKIKQDALNDILFTNQNPAATSKYILTIGDRSERQVSSGIWIASAAGSTAAIRSAGACVLPLRSKKIHYVVREPLHEKGDGIKLLKGVVRKNKIIIKTLNENGRLFLDGAHTCFQLKFGETVTIYQSDSPVTLLGINETRRSNFLN